MNSATQSAAIALANRYEVAYRSSRFLKSAYGAPLMRFAVGSDEVSLDWSHVTVDGQSILAPAQAQLFDTLQAFLCIQLQPDLHTCRNLSKTTAHRVLMRAVHIVDYFIQNASSLKLADFGLRAITDGDVRRAMSTLASSSAIQTSLYGWEYKFTEFVRAGIKTLNARIYRAALREFPALRVLDVPEDDWILELSPKELVRARAYLYVEGLLQPGKGGGKELSTLRIAKHIYGNTLWGTHTKYTKFPEFTIGSNDFYRREVPGFATFGQREVEGCSRSTFEHYRSTMRSLKLLNRIGLGPSPGVTDALEDASLLDGLSLKATGHFPTLPPTYVFTVMRHATEYFYRHGTHLLKSYVALRLAAHREGVNFTAFLRSHDLSNYLDPETRRMGVKCWSLNRLMTKSEVNIKKKGTKRPDRSEFFRRLRLNEGLLESIQVLYGAMQLVIGELSARRVSELLDLQIDHCVDIGQEWLLFYNRKHGHKGRRSRQARPLCALAVEMINTITDLHATLSAHGVEIGSNLLFARPKPDGSFRINSVTYGESIDEFLDYIEAPLTSDGKRRYIRQHQLRRFFAFCFFYATGFGGVEYLRWFFGHATIREIYEYLRESFPSSLLQSAKIWSIARAVRRSDDRYEALREILSQHFGTRDFKTIPLEALEDYLAMMRENREIDIVEHFIATSYGDRLELVVHLREIAHAGLKDTNQ